jgi:hypothetical protein
MGAGGSSPAAVARAWSRSSPDAISGAHRTRCREAERRADFFPRPLQIFGQNELFVLFLKLFERRFLLFSRKFDQIELFMAFLRMFD